MTNYAKLVEALRCCSKDKCGQCEYEWNPNREFCMNSMCADAAAAIEELQTDLKACRTISKCRLQGWKENELICEEQAKTIESIDILNKAYLEKIRKLEQQIPKRGEWIYSGEQDDGHNYYCQCSVCGAGDIHAIKGTVPYCWRCGANMFASDSNVISKNDTLEVQE